MRLASEISSTINTQGGYDNLPPTHNNYASDCMPTARIQYVIYVRMIYLAQGPGQVRW